MSIQDPTTYEPHYVAVDSVPIEIPDEYSEGRKREALFQAESRLELERNGGKRIEDEDVTAIHQSAVANLATYHLARSATDNSNITLGDLDDGGDQKERHAEQYLETYNDHIELLAEVGPGGETGAYFGASGSTGRVIGVNTGDRGRRHNLRTDAHRIVHERFLKEN